MTSKQREQRLVKLTLSEMASLPQDAVVYEGVGKMWVPLLPKLNHPPPLFTGTPHLLEPSLVSNAWPFWRFFIGSSRSRWIHFDKSLRARHRLWRERWTNWASVCFIWKQHTRIAASISSRCSAPSKLRAECYARSIWLPSISEGYFLNAAQSSLSFKRATEMFQQAPGPFLPSPTAAPRI